MARKKQEVPKKRKAHFYWWTLANALAACFAILSWLLCLHLFRHPEIPHNYEILTFLRRNDPPVGFLLQEAPPGDATNPHALYRRYAELDASTMAQLNAALMRNYLKSLREPGLIQYIEGNFEVTNVRRLTEHDLFFPGFAVRGEARVQADEFTKAAPWPVRIDYLFPTTHINAAEWFRHGDQMAVSKVPNCAMVLHVARDDNGDTPLVTLTVVPIAMGEYLVGKERKFTVATPLALNPAAEFPLFPEQENSAGE